MLSDKDEQQAGSSTNSSSLSRKRKRTDATTTDIPRSPKRVAAAPSSQSDGEDDMTEPESDDDEYTRILGGAPRALPAAEVVADEDDFDVMEDDGSGSDGELALQYIDIPPPASTSVSTPSQPLDSLPQSPSSVVEVASSTSGSIVTFEPATTSTTASSSKPRQAENTPHIPDLLTEYTCPICFSPPSNATMTPCGHICCGSCLFTAIKTTMQRGAVVFSHDPNVARCPVCRAPIPGWDGRGGGVFGLKPRVVITL